MTRSAANRRELLYGEMVVLEHAGIRATVRQASADLLPWMRDLADAGHSRVSRHMAFLEGILNHSEAALMEPLRELAEHGFIRVQLGRVIGHGGWWLDIHMWSLGDMGNPALQARLINRPCNVCRRSFAPRTRWIYTCPVCARQERNPGLADGTLRGVRLA